MDLNVTSSGLFINTTMPFLAASPDGVIYEGGQRILCEVKCPYNGRNSMIQPGLQFQFLEERDGEKKLKKNHNYYYQIIGQMAIARSKLCFFIVYTHKDLFIEKIEYDSDFFEVQVFPQLQLFFEKYYKPFIAQQM